MCGFTDLDRAACLDFWSVEETGALDWEPRVFFEKGTCICPNTKTKLGLKTNNVTECFEHEKKICQVSV